MQTILNGTLRNRFCSLSSLVNLILSSLIFCVSVESNEIKEGEFTMNFNVVADRFEQLSKVSSRTTMTELLADLFKEASAHEVRYICYLSLGTLRAPYENSQFNFAEKSLIKVIAQLLGRLETEVAAQAKELGDLGLLVEDASWQTAQSVYSVTEIYNELCALQEISGIGSQEEKAELLLSLLQKLDTVSAKYVIRIVLGTMRLGFSDMTIIDALSWMHCGNKSLKDRIEHAYNICADIGLIAQVLKQGGTQALDDMHINVGIPIRPAAAERLPNAQAIIEKIGSCIAQPKLDGFRLQIHIDKRDKAHPIIKFFSRNLIDMSYMFPDLVDALSALDVEQLICEGEAIVYDPHTGNFLPFQETVKRKRKHGITQAVLELPLRVYLFDLLYLNGQEYLSVGHEARRTKLLDLFSGFTDSAIQVIDEVTTHTAKELEDYFYKNITSGLEGVVVKKPDSVYKPGKRNFNWIKLKRQEEGQLEDTIDCVVLGYYAGSGKRAEFGIGAFLVAVYNPEKDCYESIAKIGTGLKDSQWIELKQKCDRIKVEHKPINVDVAKELYPDVWVTPEIVCIVRADEITLSPLHIAGKTAVRAGFALRFPRFIDYRLDKSAVDATTIEEVAHLYEDQYIPKKRQS